MSAHIVRSFDRGNQTPAVSFQPLHSEAAWTAAEAWGSKSQWIHALSSTDIEELSLAADAALNNHSTALHLIKNKDLYPLPTLGPKLEEIRKDVSFGRGFAIIQGIPVNKWSREKIVAAYWLIGLHWGTAVSNNKKGHLVGHIKDIGHNPNNPNTRLYATAAAQPYHNDASDLVSLLCLHGAKSGGASHWSSSISVHNKIVTDHPELAKVLAGPWYFDRKGEIPFKGALPYFEIPVFNYYKGNLSVNYSDNYYISSQRYEGVPRLTPAHLEAIRVFNEYASSNELRMDWVLQPGEIQLLSNHTCLHSRGSFEDWEDAHKKRHLLRLWVSPKDERPLPDVYEGLLGGSVVPGKRGGIVVDGETVLHVPLEAS